MRPYKLVAMSVKLSNDGQYRRVDEKMTVKRDRLWSVFTVKFLILVRSDVFYGHRPYLKKSSSKVKREGQSKC